MQFKLITLMLMFLLLSSFALSQNTSCNPNCDYTPAFSGTKVNMTLSSVTLPGVKGVISGEETFVGANFLQNLTAGPTTIIGEGYSFIGGRGNYVFPWFSKLLQNKSATLNGYDFQFYVTGSAGIIRTTRAGVNVTHWGERAGVGLNYAVNGNVGLGVEYQWFNAPDVQHNGRTFVFGPNFHF